MTDEAMSPLRRRMIEDMTIRKFAPKTQHDYVQRVKNFAAFLGRSPDTASFEDVRRFQLHLAASGAGVPTLNHTRLDAAVLLQGHARSPRHRRSTLQFVHEPRKLPVVLSPEEVARFLDAAPGLKYKAALSVAYGAGLRVVRGGLAEGLRHRQQAHDDPVEQGKGRKDRYVMLSPHLLELLRAWYKAARPQGWLFPGHEPGQPDDDAPAHPRLPRRGPDGRDQQAGVPAHAAAQLRHPSAGAEHRYPGDPGPARSCQARHHGALHPRRHQDDPGGHEPARSHHRKLKEGANRPPEARRSCRVHRWRSRTSSATTDRHGARPMPAM